MNEKEIVITDENMPDYFNPDRQKEKEKQRDKEMEDFTDFLNRR